MPFGSIPDPDPDPDFFGALCVKLAWGVSEEGMGFVLNFGSWAMLLNLLALTPLFALGAFFAGHEGMVVSKAWLDLLLYSAVCCRVYFTIVVCVI